MSTEKTPPARTPNRLSFPEDEARLAWLALLLEGYAIADEGVAEGIRREQAQDRQLACHKGCAACCRTHRDIPVYPLELMGLYWYAIEKLGGETRAKLKEQLQSYQKGDACPFLVDGACSVHPLRPLACREFNVFGAVCAEGEDAYHTRRADVLTPLKRYVDQAFDVMLPFYGVKHKAERRRMIESGEVHRLVRVLSECEWDKLAERMGEHDRRQQVIAAAEQAFAQDSKDGEGA